MTGDIHIEYTNLSLSLVFSQTKRAWAGDSKSSTVEIDYIQQYNFMPFVDKNKYLTSKPFTFDI